MALPTNVTTNTAGHAALHNDVNNEVNKLMNDTGWRDVAGLLKNGFTVGTFIRIRREHNTVKLLVRGLSGTGATSPEFLAVPAGFEPTTDIERGPYRSSLDAYTEKLQVATSTGFRMGTTGKALANSTAQIFEYPCYSTWPGVYPGVTI